MTSGEQKRENTVVSSSVQNNHFVDNYSYCWSSQPANWIGIEETKKFRSQLINYTSTENEASSLEPVKVNWKILMNIKYKLKYSQELDMEVYFPMFTKAVEKLHGKEIIIEGYVIPFDESGELLSLSYNPYAACFFCGKASPASVMSMYLKDKRKRYKMDAFKKFRGTLYLNHDDPNEFYYILRNAREE
ncbi:MAG: DUF3299 domain-containing protein [Thermonemataceae bacterium]